MELEQTVNLPPSGQVGSNPTRGTAGSSNGRTMDFGSIYVGSTPTPASWNGGLVVTTLACHVKDHGFDSRPFRLSQRRAVR